MSVAQNLKITESVVFVVDDDEAVRTSVKELLNSMGLVAEAFSSAESCKSRLNHLTPSCLVLDIRLQGQSGLSLQEELRQQECRIPIIFMSGLSDIGSAVTAMKSGAVDYFIKPFSHQVFLEAVQKAISISIETDFSISKNKLLLSKFDTLTKREKEILTHVGSGASNKKIATYLGLSEVTVKIHRSRLMKKIGAESASDLHRFAHCMEAFN